MLYNISKQSINPGRNFGPYGIAKAATLFMMRQYTLEYAKDNIRANGVNQIELIQILEVRIL